MHRLFLLPLLIICTSTQAQDLSSLLEKDATLYPRIVKEKTEELRKSYQEKLSESQKYIQIYQRALISSNIQKEVEFRHNKWYIKTPDIKKKRIEAMQNAVRYYRDILKNWKNHYETPTMDEKVEVGMAGRLNGIGKILVKEEDKMVVMVAIINYEAFKNDDMLFRLFNHGMSADGSFKLLGTEDGKLTKFDLKISAIDRLLVANKEAVRLIAIKGIRRNTDEPTIILGGTYIVTPMEEWAAGSHFQIAPIDDNLIKKRWNEMNKQ